MSLIQGKQSRAALLAVLAAGVGACGGLFGGGDKTPSAIYVLALEPQADSQQAGACGTLEVSMPSPAPGFATARMVYQREAYRLEPFAYARWAEPLAPMVQAAMIEALEASGLFTATLAAPAPVPAELSIESDALRVVQQFEGDASHAEVSLNVRLVDVRANRLLAAQRLSASVPADGDPAGGVEAANRALAEITQSLVELARRSFTCETGATATD